jgi:hypothetical protein
MLVIATVTKIQKLIMYTYYVQLHEKFVYKCVCIICDNVNFCHCYNKLWLQNLWKWRIPWEKSPHMPYIWSVCFVNRKICDAQHSKNINSKPVQLISPCAWIQPSPIQVEKRFTFFGRKCQTRENDWHHPSQWMYNHYKLSPFYQPSNFLYP